MRTSKARIVGGLAVVFAAAFGVWSWLVQEGDRVKDSLILFGNVDIRQVQLAFNGSDRIAAVLVQEGDRVRANQLLALLEPARLEAKVSARAAQVAAQREVVARLEAGNRPEDIRKARADMDLAAAETTNAEATYQRVRDLRQQKVVSPQDLDDARATLDVAKARFVAAREAHDLMVLGPRKEDLAAAKATLQVYEGDLAFARKELSDTKLSAPTNAVIQDRILEPGDMASPQRPVFTLALDDPLWVRAYVPEIDLGKIRLGMKAEVSTDTFPGKRYEAWIGFISPTAEFTPKTVETAEVRTKLVYQVRVFVRNPRGELRLGMPAVVTIPLNQSQTHGTTGETPSTDAR